MDIGTQLVLSAMSLWAGAGAMARPAVCSLGTLVMLRLTPAAPLASAWQNGN